MLRLQDPRGLERKIESMLQADPKVGHADKQSRTQMVEGRLHHLASFLIAPRFQINDEVRLTEFEPDAVEYLRGVRYDRMVSAPARVAESKIELPLDYFEFTSEYSGNGLFRKAPTPYVSVIQISVAPSAEAAASAQWSAIPFPLDLKEEYFKEAAQASLPLERVKGFKYLTKAI